MTNTITLTTIKGTEFAVAIEVVRENRTTEINLDGDKISVAKFVEITNAVATINGKTVDGNFSTNLPKWAPAGTFAIAGSIADKHILCITKEQYETYKNTLDAMIAEVETNNDAVALRNKQAKENDAYEASRIEIRKAMNY